MVREAGVKDVLSVFPGESSAPRLPYALSYTKTEDLHMCVLLQVMDLCMYFNLKC